MSTGYPTDLASQGFNHKARFSTNLSTRSNRRFNHPSSALHHRRTTNPHRVNKLVRMHKDDYHSAQNQRTNLPSTVQNNLLSNKSGPLHKPRKFSRRQKRDKASYEYFLSIASQSLSKQKRDSTTPYLSQPDSINQHNRTEVEDEESNRQFDDPHKDEELEEKMQTYKNNLENQRIGGIVNHMENLRSTYLPNDTKKRPTSQQKKDSLYRGSNKYSVFNEDKYSKYTSLRQERGLSIKPKSNDDDKSSNRSNLQKQRNKLFMNNDQKIKNIYKMTPSKPILSSVLRRNK